VNKTIKVILMITLPILMLINSISALPMIIDTVPLMFFPYDTEYVFEEGLEYSHKEGTQYYCLEKLPDDVYTPNVDTSGMKLIVNCEPTEINRTLKPITPESIFTAIMLILASCAIGFSLNKVIFEPITTGEKRKNDE
jgi:hypothetical protein